jgi:flagellar hook assembly protein FlgD
MDVYGVDGHVARRLVNGTLAAGVQRVGWDGTNGSGRRLAAGVYLLRVEASGTNEVRRLVILP